MSDTVRAVAEPVVPDGDPAGRLYLRPAGLLTGTAADAARAAGTAWPLAGGPAAFTHLEVLTRAAEGAAAAVLPVGDLAGWAAQAGSAVALHAERLAFAITARRPAVAGLDPHRTRVAGVVNVTPDSFSDGGRFHDADAAVARGRALAGAGADLLDVGGEPPRPGAEPVDAETQMARIGPVLDGLADGPAPVSVDTRDADVMDAALTRGAAVINDVSALTHDPRAPAVVARRGCPVVLMHMQGEPRTMQDDPRYACAPLDVFDALAERIAACEAAGIHRERVVVDPGIGFGKTVAHNTALLARVGVLHGLGCPVLLGVSRKSLIPKLSNGEPADRRLPGSLAAALAGVREGVQILRVHDVAETRQALAIARAVAGA